MVGPPLGHAGPSRFWLKGAASRDGGALSGLIQAAVERADQATEDELMLASLVGDRDDFVIDLRDGTRTRSYLRMEPGLVDGRFDHLPGAGRWFRAKRRLLDISIAIVCLIVFAPVMVGVAIAIKLESTGPVFFQQERVGRNGRIFKCLKFRSMHSDSARRLRVLLETDSDFRATWIRDQKVENDPRITRVGRFIRTTSLDELPQFVNVLRADMSFIGPRPVLPAETLRYADGIQEVLTVRPGMTGLWQVSGRNLLSYQERVELDRRYVREQSLRLDVSIICRTAVCAVSGYGAS